MTSGIKQSTKTVTCDVQSKQDQLTENVIKNILINRHDTVTLSCLDDICYTKSENTEIGSSILAINETTDLQLPYFEPSDLRYEYENVNSAQLQTINNLKNNVASSTKLNAVHSEGPIIDKYHDKYQADVSVNEISNRVSVNENINSVQDSFILNDQERTCTQCLMTFKYKRHLDRHLEGHQKNNCSHCNAKFARRKHLEVHLFRAHGERVTKYLYSCDTCLRSFPKRTLLNRHRAKHNYDNGKVCPDCGEMLNPNINVKDHKENYCIKKQFECKRCLQTFSIEQTYLAHLQNHNNYKCSDCDVTFASKKKVQEHYRMVHATKRSITEAKNGIYFCAECKHTSLKKDDYSRHLQSTLHLSKVNRDTAIKTTFVCPVCSKKLISRRALDQHIRRIHKKEKRFVCNMYSCTFQCSRKTDLERHKQLHIEQRNVVCEHCGKTFTSVSILNDHVLYVHNKERQFVCDECGKAFKRNSLLKRHKLSHQQHRPFVCMQCNTAFKRSHHLTRHLETCHRIMLERKRKVVKLMKTEDGHLVPVPEKPKKVKCKRMKNIKDLELTPELSGNTESFNIDASIESKTSDMQLQLSSNTNEHTSNTKSPLELTNFLSNTEIAPHVLSLVNINSGQVVTVEVTNPEIGAMNDLIDQFEANCNEILSLSDYNDLEFQNGVLSTDQSFYDHNSYSELHLGSMEGTSLSLDSHSGKIDTLPLIENCLTQPFPSFLNL